MAWLEAIEAREESIEVDSPAFTILRPTFAILQPAFVILWPAPARLSPTFAILWPAFGAFRRTLTAPWPALASLSPVLAILWPLPAGRRRTPAGGGSLPVREASSGIGLGELRRLEHREHPYRIPAGPGRDGRGLSRLRPRLERRVAVNPDLARFERVLSESSEL